MGNGSRGNRFENNPVEPQLVDQRKNFPMPLLLKYKW